MQLQQLTASQHHFGILMSDAVQHTLYQQRHATETCLNLLNASALASVSLATTLLAAPSRVFAPTPTASTSA